MSGEGQRIEELRRRITERIRELNKELEAWQTCLQLINEMLRREEKASLGMKRVIAEIRDNSGTLLAKMYEDRNEIKIIPEKEVRVNVNSKEFKQFFIGKVLENIRKENPRVEYNVKEHEGILMEISLKNISSERELRRIQGAVKWTFKKFLTG